MQTIFQKNKIQEPVLFSPSDTTKRVEGFPKICVSTFSENIIQKFASLNNTEKIAELYTANGVIPVYKIRYKDTDIAFYLSRVGAPACVVGFEEVVAMGTERFVLFGSCGVLDDEKVKDKIIIPFIQFLYGADNLSSDKWEIRDLELYGLTNAEKYMLLAFECGLALDRGCPSV